MMKWVYQNAHHQTVLMSYEDQVRRPAHCLARVLSLIDPAQTVQVDKLIETNFRPKNYDEYDLEPIIMCTRYVRDVFNMGEMPDEKP